DLQLSALPYPPPPPSDTYPLSLHDALPISDAQDLPDGERSEEFHDVVRKDDGEPIGLFEIGGDLRGCLRRGDADGAGESQRSPRSEEHTSELQSRENLVCRLLLEKKNMHAI